MVTFIIILGIYVFQFIIAIMLNNSNDTRAPRNMIDFIKLTFLPYLIFNLRKVKRY